MGTAPSLPHCPPGAMNNNMPTKLHAYLQWTSMVSSSACRMSSIVPWYVFSCGASTGRQRFRRINTIVHAGADSVRKNSAPEIHLAVPDSINPTWLLITKTHTAMLRVSRVPVTSMKSILSADYGLDVPTSNLDKQPQIMQASQICTPSGEEIK